MRLTAFAATVLFLYAPLALATSEIWYVLPEDQGECGDECYTPPGAWIDETSGEYSLGVSCDDQLILGGKATFVNEVTIGSLEMSIDGRPLGTFSVDMGLNDVYIQPTDSAAQPSSDTADALSGGEEVTLRFRNGQSYKFTLAGAKNAIGLARKLCEG